MLVGLLGTPAAADRQIDQHIKFFEKETRVCGKNLRGMSVVIERGRGVASSDPEIASDLAELTKAHGAVKSHCDEVASMLAFLLGASSETFRSIQKEFDERDNRIRAERTTSKQALADAQPVIQRVVPRMNKRIAAANVSARVSAREHERGAAATGQPVRPAQPSAEPAPPMPTPPPKQASSTSSKLTGRDTPPPLVVRKPVGTFPSRRTVELPEPAEAWKLAGSVDADLAEYSFAGVSGWLGVRVQAGVSCAHVRASAAGLVRGTVSTVEPPAKLGSLGPAWVIGWSQGDAQVRVACIASGGGSVIGRLETVNGHPPALDTMMTSMLAARLARR